MSSQTLREERKTNKQISLRVEFLEVLRLSVVRALSIVKKFVEKCSWCQGDDRGWFVCDALREKSFVVEHRINHDNESRAFLV